MGTRRFATLVRFGWRANLVCVRPEVSSDKGVGQCRAGGICADGTVAVRCILYQTIRLRLACTCTYTCTCTAAPVPATMRKAWSVDARKDQTHAAHSPAGSICGDNQTLCARSPSFDLLPCGSCGGSALETRKHAVPHCHGS